MSAMKRFSHYSDLARQDSKSRVVTIGNFDGVHIGHQAVLRAAREEADRLGLELAVLTFDPHPAEILKPDARRLRLVETSRKAALLSACGVDVALFQEFNIEVNPRTTAERLSVSMQQITAIVKSMMKEAKLFIMDEPTATLGEHEVERLFEFIAKMKEKRVSVLYISHRMDEIFGIADRVTVLKDGNYMGTREVSDITKN